MVNQILEILRGTDAGIIAGGTLSDASFSVRRH